MTALSRAFLAAYPPEAVLDTLDERLRAVPPVPGLRWVSRDQWHVTLRFCAGVPDADALVEAVTAACAGLPPVDGLRLGGAGGFPTARHGSVFWIGVTDGDAVAAVGRVAAATEGACVAVGLAREARAFHPHVTVARCSRARDLRPLVEALGDDPVGPAWTVDHVRLMASDTRSTGAVHTEVARLRLLG